MILKTEYESYIGFRAEKDPLPEIDFIAKKSFVSKNSEFPIEFDRNVNCLWNAIDIVIKQEL